ncbi:MAG: LuxR C-terminal-related transcriptional regulator [Gaiellaceae bacterium]
MDGSTTTKTIVLDAQPAFREGVRTHLGFGFSVVGDVATVAELEQLAAAAPDAQLVLIGETPRESLRSAVEALPSGAMFVVFATAARPQDVLDALALGASGYLLKGIRGDELGPALRAVLAGEQVLDPSLEAGVAGHLAGRARSGHVVLPTGQRVTLSPREQQIAVLLRSGATTRAIADELGISAITVRRHISVLMRKLNVATRENAIRLLAA